MKLSMRFADEILGSVLLDLENKRVIANILSQLSIFNKIIQ